MPLERDFAWNIGLALFAKDPAVDHQVEVCDVGVLVVPESIQHS
jgi:hypothetical protein